MIWLIRMARRARPPPSAGRAALVAGLVAVCLTLLAIERWAGWTDSLRLDRAGSLPGWLRGR